MIRVEVAMIERTEQRVDALEGSGRTPLRPVNPRTRKVDVLLPADEYDDTPWTREELQAAAWEAGRRMGWEDTDDVAPNGP